MKKVISLFLSLVLIWSTLSMVDLSAYAGDKPEYTTFQAQIYANENCGFDNIFTGTDSSSFARTLYNNLKNDALFQVGVESWEGLHIATSPSYSLESGLITKKEFYEAILFDMFDTSDEGALTSAFGDTFSKLFKMIKNEKNSFVISTATKIMGSEGITVDDLKTVEYASLSTQSQSLLLNGTKYADNVSLVSDVNKLLGYAKSIYDAIEATADYIALKECQKGTQEILEFISNDKSNNLELRLAAEEVSTCFKNSYDRVLLSICEGGFSALETSFGMVADYAWTELVSIIPGGTAVLFGAKGARALCNYLFSTDALTKGYYQLDACVSIEDALIRALESYKNSVSQNPEENAEIYMQGISMYKDIILLGFDYSIDLLEVSANSEFNTSTDFWLGDYSECVSLISQIETFKQNKINNFIRYEEIVSNKFKELYYPDYDDIESRLDSNVVQATSMSVKQIKPIILGDSGSIYDFFSFAYGPEGFTTLTWEDGVTSSDESIIKVETTNYSGDKITAIGEGSCTLTFSSNSGDFTDSIEVIVGNGSSSGNHDYYSDWEYTVNSDGTTATITKYKGSSTTVYIPSKINNYEITTIGSYTFSNQASIKKISIPNNIVNIESYAFVNCTGLTNITVPTSVTKIGSSAFNGCSSLTDITLPFIGAKAKGSDFYGGNDFGYIFGLTQYKGGIPVKQLETYFIPENLKSVIVNGGDIWAYAFENMDMLTNITIANTVSNIERCAFANCSNLKSIYISDSVRHIGEYAFNGCSSLEKMVIPFVGNYSIESDYYHGDTFGRIFGESFYDGGIETKQGNYVYYVPKTLTKVEVLGNSPINQSAFENCSNIVNIVIGDNITDIGYGAFLNCKNLKNFTFGKNVKSVADQAFSGCDNIKTLNFTGTIDQWAQIDFSYITSNPVYYTKNLYIQSKNYFDETEIILMSAPSIGRYAFYGFTNLEQVTLAKNTSSIGFASFKGCSNLTNISMSNKDTRISSETFRDCSNLKYILGDYCIKSIGSYTFYGCSNLKEINIESSESIGSFAFYNCASIENAVIGDEITSLEEGTFSGCSNLRNITIGKNVKSIGYYQGGGYQIGRAVFYGCDSLTRVNYSGSIDDWVEIDFHIFSSPFCFGNNKCCLFIDNEPITEVNLTNASQINSGAFYNCKSIEKLTIGNNLISIGAHAFSGCTSLSKVNINSIESWCKIEFAGLESNPLFYASNLYLNNELVTDLSIPNSITSIDDHAFSGCTSLTSIRIPDSVTNIGNYAFSGCTSLSKVNINSIESWCKIEFAGLESNPLFYASNLYLNNELVTDLSIPNSITSIDDHAFAYCDSLKSVTIPDSVTRIGDGTFYDCRSLTSITIPDSVISIGDSAFSSCYNLTDIYYESTNDDWCNIQIANNNDILFNAKIHYNVTDEHYIVIEKVDATCYTDGYIKYSCPCGYEKTEIISALGHTNDLVKKVDPVDCNNPGYSVYKCNVCGEEYYDDYVYIDHKYEETVIEPTCTSNGYTKYQCSVCGNYYTTDWVNALGHEKQLLEAVEPDGCNNPGYSIYECSRCGETYYDDYIYIDHQYEETVIEPTCLSQGYTTYTCNICQKSYNSDYVTAIEHNVVNGKCTLCNTAIGYNEINISLGTTSFIKNDLDCGNYTIYFKPETTDMYELSKTGWSWFSIYDNDDNCIGSCNDDYSWTTVMLNANTIYKIQLGFEDNNCLLSINEVQSVKTGETIRVSVWDDSPYRYLKFVPNHNYTYRFTASNDDSSLKLYDSNLSQLKSSGYFNDGDDNECYGFEYDFNKDCVYYIRCSCESSFNLLCVAINDHEHLYSETIVNPTCTQQGYTHSICSVCGKEVKSNYTDALGHSFEDGICKNCGKNQDDCIESKHPYDNDYDNTWTISKLNAKQIAITFSDETETEENYDYIYIYDADDNEIGRYSGTELSSKQIVVQGDTVKIRLTSDGSVTYYGFALSNIQAYYENCTHQKTEIRNVISATCTENGYTGNKYCKDCGILLESGTVITAAGHSWDSGKVTKSATCTATGVMTYTCTACGTTDTETIAKKAHTYKKYTTKATTSKNGSVVTKCTACGNVSKNTVIYYPKTITLSKTSYTYNGKVQKPSVTVKNSAGKKIASSNYTVTYAKGRKNIGKYSVKITFKGNYSGSKTLYFTIKPKATSLIKLTSGKKKFTVKWKKQTSQTTGYQIQYSTSSKFKSAKTVTVSKNKTTSKTISKLKAKKKYYVRIRTYKTIKVNGKSTKIYSSWSKAKTVITKK